MNDTMSYKPLKHLGDLAGMRPTIIIDTREQIPLHFKRLDAVRGTLYSGDYSGGGMEHLFSIEKKTVAELPGIVTGDRIRFEHELHRLRGYRFKRLVIIGTRQDVEQGNYRSNVKPRSILNSLSAWECRYDVPVIWINTPEQASAQVESWLYWFSRELVENCNDLLRAHKKEGTVSHAIPLSTMSK